MLEMVASAAAAGQAGGVDGAAGERGRRMAVGSAVAVKVATTIAAEIRGCAGRCSASRDWLSSQVMISGTSPATWTPPWPTASSPKRHRRVIDPVVDGATTTRR